MTTATTQPTVYLIIDGSAIAYEEGGEILETVDFLEDGRPDWSMATVCDHRGAGGPGGFGLLVAALNAAESNARSIGVVPVVRVPREQI
jgi:hypothetical protein